MKIKYKIILVLIIAIAIASLPLSMYILESGGRENISLLTRQGIINSQIFSRSALNIFLMNGGDIAPSRVDAGEMISALKPLAASGLLYADAVLISDNNKYNGLILASLVNTELPDNDRIMHSDRIPDDEIKRLKEQSRFKEVYLPQADKTIYEIISSSSAGSSRLKCIGRLMFSKDAVLAPVRRLRAIIFGAALLSIIAAAVIGIFFGRQISKPIEQLIHEVGIIGSGDLNHKIAVTGRDEIGRLATTFNHMTQIMLLDIRELENKNIELTRLDRLKDDFLANITHELRTPLYGVTGIAESLVAGIAGHLAKDAINNLSLMISSCKRLSSLVNDILDYSQLKHGDITLDMSSVNLYSIVRLIISIANPLIGSKKLEIKTSIEPGSFYVAADENRLQQILFNLVGNAVKFTNAGEILISADVSEEDADDVIISVRDTGIGIAKENQEVIFMSFKQADEAVIKHYPGTGMGLAITKKIVELHGGRIWVDSSPGAGSCFYFSLKAAGELQTAAGNEKAVTSVIELPVKPETCRYGEEVLPVNGSMENEKPSGRIMIVDDEPVNCQILINHLTLDGYSVIPVGSGREALDMIDGQALPDLIILDIMLPEMSGYDVCRKIRETYSYGELPVIMLTAKTEPGDLVIGFEAGANDYLTKPVSREELLARVGSLILLKKSVRERNEYSLIKQEMIIAHRIQRSLLENRLPESEFTDIAIRYFPMYEIGGDFYDIGLTGENKIALFIADVSGHGIPAAFISAMLKVVSSFYKGQAENPADFMEKINRSIYSFMEEQFITACYAVIDLDKRMVIQSNAGHWPMLIYRKSSDEIIFDDNNGMPLGVDETEKYYSSEFRLEEGDRIILYTDGIIEVRNPDEMIFGAGSFHSLVKAEGNKGIEEFSTGIIEEINKWRNSDSEQFSDDVTIIVLDILKFSGGQS